MNSQSYSESGRLPVTIHPNHDWDSMMSAVKENGNRLAKDMREQELRFVVEILTSKEVQSGDILPVRGAILPLDWKIATRLEMVESAREIITKAYFLDSLDPSLPTVLASIIEGQSMYEHSIGEFFQLYGRFEGQNQLAKGSETKAKMEKLVNGDDRYLKSYQEGGKWHLYPLPYAVRNILAHSGHNPNKLDCEGKELRTSIELLRLWVGP